MLLQELTGEVQIGLAVEYLHKQNILHRVPPALPASSPDPKLPEGRQTCQHSTQNWRSRQTGRFRWASASYLYCSNCFSFCVQLHQLLSICALQQQLLPICTLLYARLTDWAD